MGVIVCSNGLRTLVVRGFTTCTHAQNHSLMIFFFNTSVRAELSTLEDRAEARQRHDRVTVYPHLCLPAGRGISARTAVAPAP